MSIALEWKYERTRDRCAEKIADVGLAQKHNDVIIEKMKTYVRGVKAAEAMLGKAQQETGRTVDELFEAIDEMDQGGQLAFKRVCRRLKLRAQEAPRGPTRRDAVFDTAPEGTRRTVLVREVALARARDVRTHAQHAAAHAIAWLEARRGRARYGLRLRRIIDGVLARARRVPQHSRPSNARAGPHRLTRQQ